MKLELGSGYHPTAGYTHLDINPNAPHVDIVAACHPLPGIPDASVTNLRAVDVLEHLSYRDTEAVLAEWHRILAPGGRVYVQVPDAELTMRWFTESPERLTRRIPHDLPQTPLSGAAWRLLGGHRDSICATDGDDWRWNAHYAFFSAASLADALHDAGLEVIDMRTNDHPNLCCTARKQ
jgi:SAM-dependent methyltransferase